MTLTSFLSEIHRPAQDSHKGHNGKALIIGGSDLFHAASRWSFLAASRLTDMTFYASVTENNQLLYDAKFYAHDGVIVSREDLPEYIQEADSILIGPGMRRDVPTRFSEQQLATLTWEHLRQEDWETDTAAITRALLRSAPTKKWIIDAGALQVIHPEWFPQHATLTPHSGELLQLAAKITASQQTVNSEKTTDWTTFFETLLSKIDTAAQTTDFSQPPQVMSPEDAPHFTLSTPEKTLLHQFSEACNQATILLKGPIDLIWDAESIILVSGGNAGMTKGGTGDVLAGSLLGFLATSPQFASAVVASALNKLAGHMLFEQQKEMFNSSDVVEMLPRAWKKLSAPAQP